MYKIDVPTYHWDNDRFDLETKTLRFADLERAEKYQAWLRHLRFEEDSLLWHPPLRTCGIPHPNARVRVKNHDRIDVHHGAIIEASFDIYTERVIRTKIGT